jgi:hypothetical protein
MSHASTMCLSSSHASRRQHTASAGLILLTSVEFYLWSVALSNGALCCPTHVDLALSVLRHSRISRKVPQPTNQLNSEWQLIHIFACVTHILSSHSELKCSRAYEIASCTTCSFSFIQSNRSAAVGPSNQHLSLTYYSPTLKQASPFLCLWL